LTKSTITREFDMPRALTLERTYDRNILQQRENFGYAIEIARFKVESLRSRRMEFSGVKRLSISLE